MAQIAKTIAIVLIVIIAFTAIFADGYICKSLIIKKVESLDGKVLTIEKPLINKGPFILKGKKKIYRFTYEINGETKEGWVRFGLFDDWRL